MASLETQGKSVHPEQRLKVRLRFELTSRRNKAEVEHMVNPHGLKFGS